MPKVRIAPVCVLCVFIGACKVLCVCVCVGACSNVIKTNRAINVYGFITLGMIKRKQICFQMISSKVSRLICWCQNTG